MVLSIRLLSSDFQISGIIDPLKQSIKVKTEFSPKKKAGQKTFENIEHTAPGKNKNSVRLREPVRIRKGSKLNNRANEGWKEQTFFAADLSVPQSNHLNYFFNISKFHLVKEMIFYLPIRKSSVNSCQYYTRHGEK